MATIRCCLLASTLSAMAAAPPPVPVYKEFGDWVAACDNVRTCTAHAVPNPEHANGASDAQGDASLWISRDAGPAGALSLRYAGEHPGSPRSVAIDGQAVPDGPAWRETGSKDDTVATVSGAPAMALLGRMKDGAALTLSPPGSQVTFSLTGLAAALLLFDDVQGRVGTTTALGRTGPQDAAAVPPAPPLPVVHAAPVPPKLPGGQALAAAVRRGQAALLKAHECDTEAAGDDEADPLDAGTAVVFLVCLRGAYQESSLGFRVPRSAPAQARLLHLPAPPVQPRPRLGGDADLITGASYDPAKAQLGEFAKGRGLTDCGISTTWTFDGRDFHPSAYASQDRCGGLPGDWPTLFRTRAAR